jgi:hypothetical protein
MIRHIVSAAALATFALVTPALAQATPSTPQAVATQSSTPAAESCFAEMHRMAGLDKGLAADWNADRARRDCASGVYGG